MSKEFVIEIRIPLPDGIREQAKVVGSFDEAVENLKEDLTSKLGVDGFTFSEETVTKREKRAYAPRPNARGPRGPRKAANGATDEAVTA